MTWRMLKPLISMALLTGCGGGSLSTPDAPASQADGPAPADAPSPDAPPPDAGPITFGELTTAVVSIIPQPRISIPTPIRSRSIPGPVATLSLVV
jgi:hypothetical protein